MRKKAYIVLAFVLVFALIFTGCAVRRPMQAPGTTGMNTGYGNYNTGTGTYTGLGGPNATGTNYRNIGGSNNSPNYVPGRLTSTTSKNDTLARAAEMVPGVNNATVVVVGNTAYVGIDMNRNYTGTTGTRTGAGTYGTTTNPGLYGGPAGGGYGGAVGTNNTGVGTRTGVNYGGTTGYGTTTSGITGGGTTWGGATNNNAYNNYTGSNVGYGNTANIADVKRQCAQRIRATDPSVTTVYVSSDADFLTRIRKIADGVRAGSPADTFRNQLADMVRRLTPERF